MQTSTSQAILFGKGLSSKSKGQRACSWQPCGAEVSAVSVWPCVKRAAACSCELEALAQQTELLRTRLPHLRTRQRVWKEQLRTAVGWKPQNCCICTCSQAQSTQAILQIVLMQVPAQTVSHTCALLQESPPSLQAALLTFRLSALCSCCMRPHATHS